MRVFKFRIFCLKSKVESTQEEISKFNFEKLNFNKENGLKI